MMYYIFLYLFGICAELAVIYGLVYFVYVLKPYFKEEATKLKRSNFKQLCNIYELSQADQDEIMFHLPFAGIKDKRSIFFDMAMLNKFSRSAVRSLERMKITNRERTKRILHIYQIKQRIYQRFFVLTKHISNVSEIPIGQEMRATFDNKQFFFQLEKQDTKKIFLSSMEDLAIPVGTKLLFSFWKVNDGMYQFKSTILTQGFPDSEHIVYTIPQNTPLVKTEQRKEFRRNCRLNAQIFILDVSKEARENPKLLPQISEIDKYYLGFLLDISPSGCQFSSDIVIPNDTIVALKFELYGQDLIIYSKVLLCRSFSGVSIMNAHNEFVSLDNQKLIHQYINYF